MPLIAGLALLVVCAMLWSPCWPGGLAGSGLLAPLLLLLRMLGGRGALLLALPLFGLLVGGEQLRRLQLPARDHGRDVALVGQVCSFPRDRGGRRRFLFATTLPIAGRERRLRLLVSDYRDASPLLAGETWRLKLRLRSPRGLRNPGAPDRERALFAAGIAGAAYVRESALNHRLSASGWHCPGMPLRAALASLLEQQLGDRPALPYLLALTVGARHRLDSGNWRLLRQTGTVHLMAISGLHIGLIAGLGFAVTGVLGGAASGRLAWLGAVSAATAYAALAGFSVPTSRALAMLAVAAAAATTRRRLPPWTLLATALWLVLLWQPLAPLGTGFWLSFTAVAVLLLGLLPLTGAARQPGGRSARWPRWLRSLLAAQWRVWLGLLVLSAWFFGQVSTVAPLANLVSIPLIGMLGVPLALAGLLASAAGLPDWSLQAAAWLLEACLGWLGWLVEAPFPPALPISLVAPLLPLGLAGSLLCLWPRPLPGRLLLVVAVVLAGWTAAGPRPRPLLSVLVLDVGQGQAVLLRTRAHALLYDAGPAWPGGDAVAGVLLPVLSQERITTLDALVVSHADRDHSGGLQSLLAAMPVGRLLAPAGQLPGPVGAQPCRAGDEWLLDGVRLRFLHPAPGRRARTDNDRSCVLLISAGHVRILLTGDISRRAERELLVREGLPPIDLLLVPHHGSRSSSGPELVRAARARVAVASAGWQNRWGFPADEVRRRWERSGACFLVTADWGALRFTVVDGRRLRLARAERRDSRHWWNQPPPADEPCTVRRARL